MPDIFGIVNMKSTIQTGIGACEGFYISINWKISTGTLVAVFSFLLNFYQ